MVFGPSDTGASCREGSLLTGSTGELRGSTLLATPLGSACTGTSSLVPRHAARTPVAMAIFVNRRSRTSPLGACTFASSILTLVCASRHSLSYPPAHVDDGS